MVLENLYKLDWIKHRTAFTFLLGITYSIAGIFSALYLFPESPGIAALAFTSLLILPTLNKLLLKEENVLRKEKTCNPIKLLTHHSDILKIYVFLFLGILLTFAVFSLLLPQFATSAFFNEQVKLFGYTGHAIQITTFWSILLNNMKIAFFCFLTSFIYGTGAIFIITWNASVWGVFFGTLARDSAVAQNINPVVYFLLVFTAVFPHLITEASAYFLTAISGGIVSKATLREKFGSTPFKRIVMDGVIVFITAMIVLTLASFLEMNVAPYLFNLFGV